ncbi:MAG: biotin/lipoyl-binding carrier protein [Rhizobiaceae bacterium]
MSDEAIESEIAGTIWKIEVSVGDPIEEGDVLMILESMKMEIPALATCDGTITEILVAEGEGISEGQVLARIKPSA